MQIFNNFFNLINAFNIWVLIAIFFIAIVLITLIIVGIYAILNEFKNRGKKTVENLPTVDELYEEQEPVFKVGKQKPTIVSIKEKDNITDQTEIIDEELIEEVLKTTNQNDKEFALPSIEEIKETL